jgi:hypothetical protein
MKKDLKKADWAALGIISLLALILAARGLDAVWSGVYESTARYSGPYALIGNDARLMGGTFIGLGLMVFCSLGYQLQMDKKKVTLAVVAAGLVSVLCFVLRFFVTS